MKIDRHRTQTYFLSPKSLGQRFGSLDNRVLKDSGWQVVRDKTRRGRGTRYTFAYTFDPETDESIMPAKDILSQENVHIGVIGVQYANSKIHKEFHDFQTVYLRTLSGEIDALEFQSPYLLGANPEGLWANMKDLYDRNIPILFHNNSRRVLNSQLLPRF